jgi:hypothetical protein
MREPKPADTDSANELAVEIAQRLADAGLGGPKSSRAAIGGQIGAQAAPRPGTGRAGIVMCRNP